MNPNAALSTALGFRPHSAAREKLPTGLASLDALTRRLPARRHL